MQTRKFLQKKNARNARNSINEQSKLLQQEVNNLNIKLGQQKQKTIAIQGLLHRTLDKLKPLHEMHKVLSESLQPLEKTPEVRRNVQHIMDLLHEVEGEVAAAEEDGC